MESDLPAIAARIIEILGTPGRKPADVVRLAESLGETLDDQLDVSSLASLLQEVEPQLLELVGPLLAEPAKLRSSTLAIREACLALAALLPFMAPGRSLSATDKESLAIVVSARVRLKERPAAEYKPIVRAGPKIGRNELCPCGSGKKSKKCCARAI